ncbi:MAG TPA: hypothetical protein VKX46_04465 [Ktedonobacteraceae bacterium]|nr:hypothetical protein [Ktedonobacteraceae bacterium]
MTNFIGNLPVLISHAAAVGPQPTPTQATNNVQSYLKWAQGNQPAHGPFRYPSQVQAAQKTSPDPRANVASQPPSARPATMTPLTQTLDASLTTSSPLLKTADLSPLDIVGSDQRLHIQIPRGALDLSQAKTETGAPLSLPLSLRVSQNHGDFSAQVSMLALYQFQLQDAQGHAVQGVRLRKPVTISYHVQPHEIEQMGLDPTRLLLGFPSKAFADQLAQTRSSGASSAAKSLTAASGATFPMHYDSKMQTLTAQSTQLMTSPMVVGGGTGTEQSPPKPRFASVQGNSGQLSYDYPISVAQGPPGATPQLHLTYSSQGTNERHNPNAPADSVGEGWSFSLGAISAVEQGPNSAGVGTWYFISGVDNVSERLVPDSTGTNFLTEHISYVKVHQMTSSFGQPCFQAWATEGVYYGKVDFRRGTLLPFSESPLPNRT